MDGDRAAACGVRGARVRDDDPAAIREAGAAVGAAISGTRAIAELLP